MKKIALVRGKYLTRYDMELFEQLSSKYDFRAFGSLTSPHDIYNFPITKLFSPLDIPHFPYKNQLLNRLFIDAHVLCNLENELKGFDIAHTAETYFHFTQQCIKAKQQGYIKKIVCTVFENIPFNNEKIWGRKKFKKNAREYVDHFISVTNESKQALLLEGVENHKISVIGMGINIERFSPQNKKSSKETNILFVGRLEVFKGIFDVLDVVARFVSMKENNKFPIRLTIIGKGSKENLIFTTANRLGIRNIIDIKSVNYSDIPAEYRRADIFIAPSKQDTYWREQYGMVLLEAMSSGLPIITTGQPTIREVVGNVGLYIQEGNKEELFIHLNTLIKNVQLRNTYAALSRARALRVYDMKIVARKMSTVYNSLLL